MLDLADPEQNLRAFVRINASLDGADTVIWFTGNVHTFVHGERSRRLFAFEGYNVRRVEPIEGGYRLLSREAVFYKDPEAGQILDRWTNPMTGREVEVVHVLNDPVNNDFVLEGRFGRWNMPVTGMDDDVYFNTDIFLSYPSPLPRVDYPEYSQSDQYEAAELFQFFARRSDLENEALPSVPMQVSWTRLGPWLPWMEMGDRPGMLVYHCRGKKLPGGYAQVPEPIRAYVEAHHPEYQTAPREVTGPNETSWTYFKKRLEARRT